MKKQMKHAITLLGVVCLSSLLNTGCSSTPAPGTDADQVIDLTSSSSDTAEPSEPETTQDDASTNASDAASASGDTSTANAEGKWHVLSPEVAAAVDADFEGVVWKIDGDSFSIVEITTEILDDGTMMACSPSSDAEIPDSELIPVVYDENTHFYMRTIRNGGDSYEDTEATFQDIEKDLTVEMKGSFKKDVFYAVEIRIVKVS